MLMTRKLKGPAPTQTTLREVVFRVHSCMTMLILFINDSQKSQIIINNRFISSTIENKKSIRDIRQL